MTTRWNIDDLRLLVLVASSGSIGRAAAEVGLTQPTTSRRLAALERSCGLPLLERGRRGTSLTPTGQVVVDWATTLLRSIDDFDRSLDLLRDAHRPAIRVAVSMTIAEHHAPRWISTLRTRHPEIAVTLLVDNSRHVAEMVQDGRADVGFVESRVVPPDLQRQHLAWDRLVVAVCPGHPWAELGRRLSAADLGATPLLVRERGSGTRETLEQALAVHDTVVRPAFEMASNTALKSAALAGMGPVVLSRTALAPEIAAGRLVAAELADIDLRRPFTAVWRTRRDLPEAVRILVGIAAQG